MSRPAPLSDDPAMLSALAIAMVEQPRANLQELAQAIGVSKATLYRFCRTREELVQRLVEHIVTAFREGLRVAELGRGTPIEALRRLTEYSLAHRELHAFLIFYWKDASKMIDEESGWVAGLDDLFLRGQREGLFRIDISAPALTEIWFSLLIGLLNGERCGRIARVGLGPLIESAFLHGAAAR